MGSSLRSALSMFSWFVMNCYSIPLPHEIMQINVWSSFINKSISRYKPQLSKICQVGLQLLEKKQNFVQNMDLWIFAIISPIQFLSHPHYAHPRIPPKVSGFSLICMRYPLDFKKGSTKVPCICTSLHAPNSTT